MNNIISKCFEQLAPIWIDKLEKELKPTLQYHSINHVLSVIERVEFIGSYEGLDIEKIALVKIAALFHDSGFLVSPKNHEETSCSIVRSTLPAYGLSEQEIDHICDMIMATKIPQSPKDLFGEVLCDADLDYLGTEDYEGPANKLRDELNAMNMQLEHEKWLDLQIGFLETHRFFTTYAQQHREPQKKLHLRRLKSQKNKLIKG